MAKHCAICSKQALKANKVCFSNKHHTYRQQPNLQTIRADVNGNVQKISVCTSCLKANKVKKVI